MTDCPGCTVKPPSLSADTLKNIGTNICRIPEDQLDESSLNQRKKLGFIAKKKGNIKSSKKAEEDKKQDD